MQARMAISKRLGKRGLADVTKEELDAFKKRKNFTGSNRDALRMFLNESRKLSARTPTKTRSATGKGLGITKDPIATRTARRKKTGSDLTTGTTMAGMRRKRRKMMEEAPEEMMATTGGRGRNRRMRGGGMMKKMRGGGMIEKKMGGGMMGTTKKVAGKRGGGMMGATKKVGMKKGGQMKTTKKVAMKKSSIDGIARKGKTRGRMV